MFLKNDLCIKTIVAIIFRKGTLGPIAVKNANKYFFIVHNFRLKLLISIYGLLFKNNYMLMSLQIFKLFYIFVLYFQLLLRIIERSLVATHFFDTRN